jgi:ribosomal-protein-alanine N-acetyltransferase
MTAPLPTLESDRLILRPLTLDDAPAVFDGCRDPRVTEFTSFDTHQSVETSVAYIRDIALPHYADGRPEPFGIAWKHAPERVIGCTGARVSAFGESILEGGYWIAASEWGKGVATEAFGRLVRYLFETRPVHRVQAVVFPGNAASERVLTKLGFRYEGTLRQVIFRRGRWTDDKLFSMLREEFERG